MRDEGKCYSYVAYYCDNLVVVHNYPDHVFDSIWGKGFNINHTSTWEYVLSRDFDCVKEPKSNNKILTWVSNTYAKHMMYSFNNSFGFEPTMQHAALPTNYKSDLDITDLCKYSDKYQ